jgi:hypothetical protein
MNVPAGFFSIFFTSQAIVYISGGFGTFLKTTNSGVGFIDYNKKTENNLMTIYPNPIKDKFTINISEINIEFILLIYNLNGQQIITQNLTKPQTQIDISLLKNGVYLY